MKSHDSLTYSSGGQAVPVYVNIPVNSGFLGAKHLTVFRFYGLLGGKRVRDMVNCCTLKFRDFLYVLGLP